MARAFLNRFQFLDIRHLWRWGVKAGIAFFEQGLFSISNFVVYILLARWLSPEEYGAFSVAFAIYLFFTGIHNALIIEPMTVLGPANHSHHMVRYILGQFKFHFFVTGILGVVMIGLGYALLFFSPSYSVLSDAVIAAGVMTPLMLLPWLVRRLFYLIQLPSGALLTSGIYALMLTLGVFVLRRVEIIGNLSIWFGLMGLAGFSSSSAIILIIKGQSWRSESGLFWQDILIEQWKFGKWVLGATVLYAISTQVQVFLTAGLIDLGTAGAWRALQNITLPVMQGIAAFSILGMPVLAIEYGAANYCGLKRKGMQLIILMTSFSLVCEALLVLFASPLEGLIYGEKYTNFVWMIPFLGIIPVLNALTIGYSLILRSLQRPSYYLVSNLIAAIVAVISGVVLTHLYGIAGAMWSALLVAFIALLVNIGYYRIWFGELTPKNTSQNIV